jgi:hypothetical protein
MTIEFAQIISTIDQRPDTTDPVPVFMDQNDAISGIEHSNEHPADIRIVANSNVRCTITDDKDKDVIVNQAMMPFNAGDVLNVMMAVEKTGEGLGIEAIKTEGRPLIPSIIFSMHKIKDEAQGHWISTQKGTKKVWIDG